MEFAVHIGRRRDNNMNLGVLKGVRAPKPEDGIVFTSQRNVHTVKIIIIILVMIKIYEPLPAILINSVKN